MDAGNIKLLVIEDDPAYLELLQSTLAEAVLGGGTSPVFEVVTAGNLRDGISLLARNNADAVLLDLFLPDSQGQDTFRKLYSQAPYVPIIVMSSLDDQDTAIESVKAGAQDYLVKGQVAGDLLVRAIRYAIQRKQSERALQEAHDDLEQRIEDRTAELAQVNARLEEDIAARKMTEMELQASNSLLSAISHVQSLYVSDARPERVFDELLHVLVSVTESEYGFIAEVLYDDTGRPYLQSRYISDITWNAEIERFHDENFSDGLKFTKLETLSGAVITSSEAVVSNGPEADPRSYGLPSGHPPLNSFLGVPFYEGATLVGVAGVANRPDGYDEALLDFLKPLTAAATSLIVGKRSNQRREEEEQALRDSEVKYRTLIQSGRDAIISTDASGRLISWNQGAETMFGYSEEEILGQLVTALIPERYQQLDVEQVLPQLTSGILPAEQQVLQGWGQRKDGSEFPTELSLSGWTVGGDNFITVIIRDVTDRRRIEEEVLEISEREQRRISQNLHDDLGQKLTGIAFLGQALAQRLDGAAGELSEDATRIAQQANEAINSARRLARELYPVNLARNDLESALAELVAGVESYSGITCEMSSDITVPLKDHQIMTHLYRIAQEALNNAVRHSGAREINVKLTIRPELTQLEVYDDGVGMPEDLISVMGMGLHNMKYRANAIRGSLEIGSRIKGGTGIICLIKNN